MEQPAVIDNTNGDGNYKEFLEELAAQGIHVDGDKVAREGINLLEASPQRQAAVHYLATISQAGKVYKDDPLLAMILDQMARSVFMNREERLKYIKYVEWCMKFKRPLNYAAHYIVSAISENGRSRDDLVAAVTTINQTQRHFNYGNQSTRKDGTKPGITSG